MEENKLLIKQIIEKKQEYRTDSYPMSLGEIINLYRDQELIINPDFQRYFRWTNRQRSRLIESILLGIPIPSIFVYQTNDGKWEIVDGLQRVSTILEFTGELRDKTNNKLPPLKLEGIENLNKLNDLTWKTLPDSLRLDFKRSKFKIEIIQKESDPNAKFEVFMRLNTGGSNLSDQELRNSWLVMYNKEFFNWLEELSKNTDFSECISLSEKLEDERYDMELILSYLAYPIYYDQFSKKEKVDLLTDALKELATKALNIDFEYDNEKGKFEKTFRLLNNLLQDNVFKKYDRANDKFKGKFLESLFEVITIGLSHNIDQYNINDNNNDLIEKIKNLWNEEDFTSNMGSGTNTKIRVPSIIPFGKTYFNNE